MFVAVDMARTHIDLEIFIYCIFFLCGDKQTRKKAVGVPRFYRTRSNRRWMDINLAIIIVIISSAKSPPPTAFNLTASPCIGWPWIWCHQRIAIFIFVVRYAKRGPETLRVFGREHFAE